MSLRPPRAPFWLASPKTPTVADRSCTSVGARRVSNLSEEQRNKKRENDRIAQQNIRRRNKELIEKLQQEVEFLRKLDRVDLVKRLMKRNKELEDEVFALRKTLFIHTGRPYTSSSSMYPRSRSSTTFSLARLTRPTDLEIEGLPPGGHAGDNYVPHTFGSPYLGAANPYDQWPSGVVPVPPSVTANSVESSPGASGPGEDFTPAYVHTSMPSMDGPVITSGTSAHSSLGSSKGEYQELDTGMRADTPLPLPPLLNSASG